jgi:hypothetical protein
MNKKELEQHICSALNISSLTPIISSQITKFVTERGLKYDDIARAVSYYMEVEKTPYQPKFGIGLIPYMVDKANAYYAAIEAQKKSQLRSLTIASSTPDIILAPTKLQKRKSIDPIDISKLDTEGSGE